MKYLKGTIAAVFAAGFVAFGAWAAAGHFGASDLAPKSSRPTASDAFDASSTGTAEPTPNSPPAPNPVSLEALSLTAFDGRDFVLGRVLAENDAYVRHYITYRSGKLKISGVMNIPRGQGPFPLLVLAHGYIDPEVYTNGRGLKREQDYLARKGYAVLHVDYRGHADSDPDHESDVRLRIGYAEDAINAVYAVRAAKLERVDASRVGMLGHSMGGGVTLQTITAVPDLVQAAVLFAPVSGDARLNFERWTKTRPEVASKIVEAYGAPTENAAFWEGVSPSFHLDKVTAPVLLHHGTADESCPYEWSVSLADAMKKAGVDVTFHTYERQPHEFTTAWPEVMARTVAFYDAHLKAEAAN